MLPLCRCTNQTPWFDQTVLISARKVPCTGNAFPGTEVPVFRDRCRSLQHTHTLAKKVGAESKTVFNARYGRDYWLSVVAVAGLVHTWVILRWGVLCKLYLNLMYFATESEAVSLSTLVPPHIILLSQFFPLVACLSLYLFSVTALKEKWPQILWLKTQDLLSCGLWALELLIRSSRALLDVLNKNSQGQTQGIGRGYSFHLGPWAIFRNHCFVFIFRIRVLLTVSMRPPWLWSHNSGSRASLMLWISLTSFLINQPKKLLCFWGLLRLE